MVTSCITVHNVTFSYNGIKALSGVSFDVRDGEFLGIIGPNGSGKTTLLRCIAGILLPEQGEIYINKRNIKDMKRREVAKVIAVVPQLTPVDFAFTVREMVLMGRTPHLRRFSSESKEDLDAVDRAMRETGISALADRTFDELSGGERQKVVIAQALAQGSKILLMDEPTQHLDISAQYQILELVKRLNMSGRITVISVLHDLNLASRYSDSLILMKNGKIYAKGSVESVLTPENISACFGVHAVVYKHHTPGIHIIPLP
jgi:iron complex transport system ATP-binding protein